MMEVPLTSYRPFGNKYQFGKAANPKYESPESKKVTTVKLEPLDMTVDPNWEFKTLIKGGKEYVICPKCNCWTARKGVPCDHDLSTPVPEAIQRAGIAIKRKPKSEE